LETRETSKREKSKEGEGREREVKYQKRGEKLERENRLRRGSSE